MLSSLRCSQTRASQIVLILPFSLDFLHCPNCNLSRTFDVHFFFITHSLAWAVSICSHPPGRAHTPTHLNSAITTFFVLIKNELYDGFGWTNKQYLGWQCYVRRRRKRKFKYCKVYGSVVLVSSRDDEIIKRFSLILSPPIDFCFIFLILRASNFVSSTEIEVSSCHTFFHTIFVEFSTLLITLSNVSRSLRRKKQRCALFSAFDLST